MGGVIGTDPWLETLAAQGGNGAAPAVKLMRTQILTSNRRGHRIELNTEYLRRRICHAARYGHIAEAYVACSRCGTQARLSDWVAAAEWDRKESLAVWEQMARKVYKEYVAYLQPCPGEEWAALVALSRELPDTRRQ